MTTTLDIPGLVPPASQLSADDIEKTKRARILQRIQVLRETPRKINDAEVKGSPDRVYCWVFDHPQMISEYERLGYEVVRAASGKNVESKWKRQDGTHKRGDTILMQIDREEAEVLETLAAMNAIDQVSSAKSQFSEFANNSGIPMFNKR